MAERTPAGASATGYWPPPLKDEAKTESSKPKGAPRVRVLTRARAKARATAMVGCWWGSSRSATRGAPARRCWCGSSQIVAWDWQADTVCLLKGEDLLGEHDPSLPVGGVAMPSQPCFDSTEDGLIVACYLLPPWQPGISAIPQSANAAVPPHGPVGCRRQRQGRRAHRARTSGDNGDLQHPGGTEPTADERQGPCPSRVLIGVLLPSHMVRLSPDGTTLAFAAHADEFRSHSTAFELRTMPWPPPPREAGAAPSTASRRSGVLGGAGASRAWIAADHKDGSSFAGVFGFHDELASMAWLDAKTLIFHSRSPQAPARAPSDSTAVPSPPVLPLRATWV